MGELRMGVGDRAITFLLLVGAGFIVLPLKISVLYTVFCLTVALWLLHNEKSYFNKHGIPSPKGELILGHSRMMFKSLATFDIDTLKQLGTNYFGAFMLNKKEYTSADLDFVKAVCVKEFSHFQNRAFIGSANTKVGKKSIMRNIVSIKTGEDWKRVRNRVTPTFTTGKIKKLIPTFNECAKKGFGVVEEHIKQGKELDLKVLMSQIGMDVIGRGGFSMDLDVYSPEESIWLINARKSFSGFLTSWKTLFVVFCPLVALKIEQLFGVDMLSNDAQIFFEKFVLDLYDKRKAEPSAKETYTDIFQLLLNLLTGDRKKFLTKAELVSQSFLLLIAGYETTATVLQFILYILALHPDVQDKLRMELEEAVGDEEEITFDHMQKFTYMNQVIQEALRLYNPAPRINRECNDPITLNGLHIDDGDTVNIPVAAIHHNPEYYPDPYKFDPDRFTEEEKAKRDPRVYLPFGIGPRNCLGMRFAEFQMRVVLGQLVKNFKFEKGENSPELPIKIVFNGVIRPEKTLFAKVNRC
ncbi:cytochrome p450 domain-containing protein [Ditylenchus destructor]|uniref:Cytochrome p450 domain-containing protein n=1 Tax=Ditylenchus destructor TaxID=166010 RepID=A0AAD4N273_9BILA|nr:cytochrome p450 domain-containing protein [Ditylenchus destructor]